MKENFLCRSAFKGATKLTKEDIERVFALYDRVSQPVYIKVDQWKNIFNIKDKNGTIENEELKGFLKDLLELVKRVWFILRVKYMKKYLVIVMFIFKI